MIVEKIAEILKCKFKSGKADYLITKTDYNGRTIILVKPLTYMNNSGVAVLDLIQRFKPPQANLLIVLDDFNLPFGKLRFRSKGNDGGHNGLQSVIYQLESELFSRLRIGVGNDNMKDPVVFVLSKFDKEEKKEIPFIIQHTAEACLDFVELEIEKVMNKYN